MFSELEENFEERKKLQEKEKILEKKTRRN